MEIEKVFKEFSHVMLKKLLNKLPPRTVVDHKIELEPGMRSPAKAPYRMALTELEELRKKLKELLDTGFIQPSKALLWSSRVVPKEERWFASVYHIPLIADLFDQLGRTRYFTKLDLRSGYYQIRNAEGDEAKITCITRYGSFEVLVMPFGLTNTSAIFCTFIRSKIQPRGDVYYQLINESVVQSSLGDQCSKAKRPLTQPQQPFAIFQSAPSTMRPVYLDDIIVYSVILEEHAQYLRSVFKILSSSQLYMKKKKCSFARQKNDKLFMKDGKVRAIQEWKPPTKVPKLRSFLGLANYYRRFIKGYSAIVSPLMDLLKKNMACVWTESCQKTFKELKKVITSELVLSLAVYSKPFEVHTDTSNFAIGGLLMQKGHPISFECRKLNDTERRHSVHEKEITTMVHCLLTWRHYLLGSKFVMMTDNVAMSYFQTQKKLTPKQARSQVFLTEFDFEFAYKLRKANLVADVLSRKAALIALSKPQSTLLERIKEGLEQDPMAKPVGQLIKDGKNRKCWLEDDCPLHIGQPGLSPKVGELEEGDHSRVSRLSMCWTSENPSDIGLGERVLLLAKHGGG
ncbi:Retrovirus-related Pol polyprotein from transposon 17.6-like protein [Drosera capensis]